VASTRRSCTGASLRAAGSTPVWQAAALQPGDGTGRGGALDSSLLRRVREVVGRRPVTESELRALVDATDGWARALQAQVDASERRLARLAADPASPLAEQARELRRVELLQPALDEACTLLAGLEARARRLRSDWLLSYAGRPAGQDTPVPPRPQ
jgi:hypothetical protein